MATPICIKTYNKALFYWMYDISFHKKARSILQDAIFLFCDIILVKLNTVYIPVRWCKLASKSDVISRSPMINSYTHARTRIQFKFSDFTGNNVFLWRIWYRLFHRLPYSTGEPYICSGCNQFIIGLVWFILVRYIRAIKQSSQFTTNLGRGLWLNGQIHFLILDEKSRYANM